MKNNTNEPAVFVPVPDAFMDADRELRNLFKFEFRSIFSARHRIQTVFSTNRVLIDLSELNSKKLNTKKMIADCDYLKSILQKYPKEIGEMVGALNENSKKGILKAEKIRAKIGLTEKASARAGGGLLWLIIPLVVIGTGSGCGTLNSNKPFKQPTTPKPPPPPPSQPQ